MMASSQAKPRAVLDRETDARFWAQTHYRVGERLNAADPTDRAMMKVWLDIFAKVKREDQAGQLVLTYTHPAVEQYLDDARLAMQAAEAHLDAAAKEPDPVRSQQHADAATRATSTASSATYAAAALQPATVSPVVVALAANEAAAVAAVPLPLPIVEQLPAGHPAVSSPAARPVLPPELATAPSGPPSPAVPTGPLAVAQAVSAPAVAVSVHEDAQARADQGEPPPTGMPAPQTIAQMRDIAIAVAEHAPVGVVGVTCAPPQQWTWLGFSSLIAAADWYGQLCQAPEKFLYIAYYDKTGDVWPQPLNEVFGAGRPLVVTAHVDPSARPQMSGAVVVIMAVLGLAGVAALASRKGSP